MANYSGEKSPTMIEKLKKVLQIHSQCFISTPSENGIAAKAENLPFSEDVQNQISDHVTTYHKLVEKLKTAELIAAPPKVINKESNVPKTNGINGSVQDTTPSGPAAENTKPAEPKITAKASEVVGKAPSPKQQNRKITDNLQRTNDVPDSTTAVHDETNTPDSSQSTSPTLSKNAGATTSESENDQQQTETAVSTATETCVTEHVDKAAPTTSVAIPCDDDTNKNAVLIEETTMSTDAVPAPPARPAKTPRKDISSAGPESKLTPDVSREGSNGKSTGSSNGEDTGSSLLRSPRRDNIPSPSPKVKPRASMKVKKAPPPPPAAAPTASTEKPTPEKPPAPRRPMKTPQKVPPPRPKPPSVKKKSMVSS